MGGMRAVAAIGAVLALAGCGSNPPPVTTPTPSSTRALAVRSDVFTAGKTIPFDYTCRGSGLFPPLSWSGDLSGIAALALVVDDPDAPGGDFLHWVVLDLPPTTTGISTTNLPAGAHQAKNSAGTLGWTPPCPPAGTHRYRFTVYGLTAPTGLADGVEPVAAQAAIVKAASVSGQLVGTVSH
jgi:Raf kinase inhibitor-like YbhB/YbcL family protein